MSGKLSFEGPARIDGQVDGEITAKDRLMIGESAVVTAQIKAASIIVAGKVSGDITASQRIEIRPSAKVVGNLTAPILVVHEGAVFRGPLRDAARGSRARIASSPCIPRRSAWWRRPEVRNRPDLRPGKSATPIVWQVPGMAGLESGTKLGP